MPPCCTFPSGTKALNAPATSGGRTHAGFAIRNTFWWSSFRGAVQINPLVPPEIKKKMTDIMINYITSFGPEGVFERFNNRSIAQILAEYEPGQADVIASGEEQGVKWRLTKRKGSE
jgi:hypothetical protein